MPTFTEADSGREIQMAAGTAAEIRLEATPSSGCSWILGAVDQKVLAVAAQPVQETPQRSSAAGPMTGAPGVAVFQLEARAPGKTAIALAYRAPWEKGPAYRQFQLTVEVTR
jgi:predicted secreted protein